MLKVTCRRLILYFKAWRRQWPDLSRYSLTAGSSLPGTQPAALFHKSKTTITFLLYLNSTSLSSSFWFI